MKAPEIAEYTVMKIGWYQTVLMAKDTKPAGSSIQTRFLLNLRLNACSLLVENGKTDELRLNFCVSRRLCEAVSVPNGYFVGATVINVSRQTHRVLVLDFRVMYQDRDKIYDLIDDFETYLRGNAEIDSVNHPVRVNVTNNNPDHITLNVEAHARKLDLTTHYRVKSTILMELMDLLEKRTTGTAYPTAALRMERDGAAMTATAAAAQVSAGRGGSSGGGAPLVGGASGTGWYDAASSSAAAATAAATEAGKPFVYNLNTGEGEDRT